MKYVTRDKAGNRDYHNSAVTVIAANRPVPKSMRPKRTRHSRPCAICGLSILPNEHTNLFMGQVAHADCDNTVISGKGV